VVKSTLNISIEGLGLFAFDPLPFGDIKYGEVIQDFVICADVTSVDDEAAAIDAGDMRHARAWPLVLFNCLFFRHPVLDQLRLIHDGVSRRDLPRLWGCVLVGDGGLELDPAPLWVVGVIRPHIAEGLSMPCRAEELGATAIDKEEAARVGVHRVSISILEL
jgi:hypothetical protein